MEKQNKKTEKADKLYRNFSNESASVYDGSNGYLDVSLHQVVDLRVKPAKILKGEKREFKVQAIEVRQADGKWCEVKFFFRDTEVAEIPATSGEN